MPSSTETAVANGDTRTLNLYHSNTHESIEATFRVNGQYDPAVLEKLNWFLRDWRRDEATHMDPRLFDVVWEVYRSAGASEPITVYSAYRSPETNSMLRRRSRAVAEHSQHMLGKAMDTTMPGMSMEKIREIGMRMQRGGVGYYQNANFVHLDVGNVRSWPRMSYDQLSRLFPDGKTVHIPSNGQPLARYEEARAEIEANGGGAYAPPSQSKGFFAWLFNSGKDDDEGEETVVATAPSRRGTRTAAAQSGRMQTAALATNAAPAAVAGSGEDAGRNFFALEASRQTPAAPALRGRPAAPTPTPIVAQSPAPTPAAVAQQPPDEAKAQVAAIAATSAPVLDVAEKAPFGTLLPIPPRRPLELAAANVPVPPARPIALAANFVASTQKPAPDTTSTIPPAVLAMAALRPSSRDDAIGNLIASTAAAPPAPRTGGGLPAVITQGSNDRRTPIPAQSLAYAPTAQIRGLRTAARSKSQAKPVTVATVAETPTTFPIVSARLDRSNFRSLTAAAATTETPSQSILGPAIAGVRQAARIVPGTLSGQPSAGYVASFGIAATDLDTAHFSGSAVQPLPARGVLFASSALRRD